MKLFVSDLSAYLMRQGTHAFLGRSSIVRHCETFFGPHLSLSLTNGLGSILDIVKEVNVCYVSTPYCYS